VNNWRKYLDKFSEIVPGGTCNFEEVMKTVEWLPKGLILDVGAGKGDFTTALNEAGFECEAFDWVPQKEFVVKGDMHDMYFEDKVFDGILCTNVFEHSLAPLIALCEFNRVLKPKGKALIIIPIFIERWIKSPEHTMLLNRMQMENLFNKAKFKLIKFENIGELDYYLIEKEKDFEL